MDLLIPPKNFFGILAEYNISMIKNPGAYDISPGFEGGISFWVDIPGKPSSLLTLQIRRQKIIYNELLKWKLAAHFGVPAKVMDALSSHAHRG